MNLVELGLVMVYDGSIYGLGLVVVYGLGAVVVYGLKEIADKRWWYMVGAMMMVRRRRDNL
jgi:hypothetical protein